MRGRPSKLTSATFTLFVLHAGRGESLAQIAEACGVTQRTAQAWLRRGRDDIERGAGLTTHARLVHAVQLQPAGRAKTDTATAARCEAVGRSVRGGASIAGAAREAGLGTSVVYGWVARGRADTAAGADTPCARLAEAVGVVLAARPANPPPVGSGTGPEAPSKHRPWVSAMLLPDHVIERVRGVAHPRQMPRARHEKPWRMKQGSRRKRSQRSQTLCRLDRALKPLGWSAVSDRVLVPDVDASHYSDVLVLVSPEGVRYAFVGRPLDDEQRVKRWLGRMSRGVKGVTTQQVARIIRPPGHAAAKYEDDALTALIRLVSDGIVEYRTQEERWYLTAIGAAQ